MKLALALLLLGVLPTIPEGDPPHDAIVRCPPPIPRPVPPPPIEAGPRGRVTVRSDPEAVVVIDGQSAGRTPVIGQYLDPGRHVVVARASCGTRRETFRVAPGSDVSLDLHPCRGTPIMRPR